MAENLLDISKGLHQDYHPISQPVGTYTYLLNAIRLLSGAIENEKGTTSLHVLNKKVLGGYVLDEDIVLFLYPSEIGVVRSDDTYVKITDRVELNFQEYSHIDCEGKKNTKGERIIYPVDGYNPDRRINLDDPILLNSSSFADDIKLQLTPHLPEVVLDSVVDGGSLPSGVYQATARLLTASTNATPFGMLSPLISIVDEPTTSSFNDIDGAPPQTPTAKAIRFTIDNIDAGYSFIEVAIITYVGTANISNSYLVTRLPIDGRTSITFTYSSTDQHLEAIDLTNIAVKPVTYDHAKFIAQKDNILVRSHLQAIQESFDFQEAVNAITLKYTIEEIPWQEGYKDVFVNALKRNYRRGEVYSFAASPEFATSYTTTAYHIAAPVTSTNLRTQANPVTQELGTYVSREIYPANKNYPDSVSNLVRHFVMPTMQQEPIIVKRNNQVYLRLLGIQADFTQALALIPDDVKKRLNGFSILRQVRLDKDKSILTQGIAQIHGALDFNTFSNAVTVVPGSGATNLGTREGIIDGYTYFPKDVAFYSPESVIYQKNFTDAQQIEPLTRLIGTQTIVADKRTNPDKYVHSFLDYDSLSPFPTSLATKNILSNTVQYVPAGSATGDLYEEAKPLVGVNDLTATSWHNNGYLYLRLTDNLPINEQTFAAGYPELRYDSRVDRTDLVYINGQELTDTFRSTGSIRYLYNLTKTLTSQYGNVFEASYIYCSSYSLNSTSSILQFYGGDTFIGKFGVVSSTAAYKYGDTDFKTLNYFFVESEINIDYRHYNQPIGTEGQSGFIPGTMPYYPKYQPIWDQNTTRPGLLNLSWTLGHARGYNKQYSFENSIIKYNPKQLAEEVITGYENRSIYSEQSVEGEQLDAFRIFLPNNYHDIPKERGVITDTFVHLNDFYHHTSGALYRSFFNEKVTLASNIGQVYLGKGDVFDRPSTPIKTVAGGYAGTQGQWGISTPFGYFFVDARQKMVFCLTEQLEDLSGQGMDEFFSTIQETDSFQIAFDYKEKHKRILLSSSQGWTLSYQAAFKSWTGFHSYVPEFMISRGKSFYMVKEQTFYKHNVGPYGTFFGAYYPTILEYVSNVEAKTTKKFDNCIIHSNTYQVLPIPEPKLYETFTNLRVYNELKDTGEVELLVPQNFQEEWVPLGIQQTFAKYKNQEYRVAVPVDLLEDPNTPNVYVSSTDFRPRMTGKWAKYRWTFNRPNRKFVLHTIDTQFRAVAR